GGVAPTGAGGTGHALRPRVGHDDQAAGIGDAGAVVDAGELQHVARRDGERPETDERVSAVGTLSTRLVPELSVTVAITVEPVPAPPPRWTTDRVRLLVAAPFWV